jgi:hypothetical protein
MTDALFRSAGDGRWEPTDLARGPWDPAACHGGPVGALLVRAVETVPADGIDVEWQLARITIELTRPVPVGRPLTVDTTVERPGKRVSLVAVRLTDGDTEVARARALRTRRTAQPLPSTTVHPPAIAPGAPDDAAPARVAWAASDQRAFHTDACEHRFTEGGWDRLGPVGVWIRLRVPTVAGEEPSGAQRAVAAADFGNGVSAGLPYDDYTFINPDLTVHFVRPPAGEWIGMRTASFYSDVGGGLAESELFDADGRIGRSAQSLFVAAR